MENDTVKGINKTIEKVERTLYNFGKGFVPRNFFRALLEVFGYFKIHFCIYLHFIYIIARYEMKANNYQVLSLTFK